MESLNMWTGELVEEVSEPMLSTTGEVCFLNAEASGIIIPSVSHSVNEKKVIYWLKSLIHLPELFGAKFIRLSTEQSFLPMTSHLFIKTR